MKYQSDPQSYIYDIWRTKTICSIEDLDKIKSDIIQKFGFYERDLNLHKLNVDIQGFKNSFFTFQQSNHNHYRDNYYRATSYMSEVFQISFNEATYLMDYNVLKNAPGMDTEKFNLILQNKQNKLLLLL